MVLVMMGRDDFLLSASLNKPAVPSDIDVSSWRNHGSLRVRNSSMTTRPRGWSFSGMPCLTFCRRLDATILDLDDRSLPRFLGSLLPSAGPQVCAMPDRRLHRVAQALFRGSVTQLGALATRSTDVAKCASRGCKRVWVRP